MMNTTKINYRVDVVSRQKKHKTEMIRVVRNKNDEVFIDRTYKQEGRSVYFVPTLENLVIIKKKNMLSRGLKARINDSIYEEIKSEIEVNWNGKN